MTTDITHVEPPISPSTALRPILSQIERLVEQLEHVADPATRSAARAVVGSLLEMHAAALRKMIGILNERDPNAALVLAAWGSDETVSRLLVLHDLHPLDSRARVEQAVHRLANALPGGITADIVSLDCSGLVLRVDPGTRVVAASELRTLMEDAVLGAAPEVELLHIEGLPAPEVHLVQINANVCGCHGSHTSNELKHTVETTSGR